MANKFHYKQEGHFRDRLKRISAVREDVDLSMACATVMEGLADRGVAPDAVTFPQVKGLLEVASVPVRRPVSPVRRLPPGGIPFHVAGCEFRPYPKLCWTNFGRFPAVSSCENR